MRLLHFKSLLAKVITYECKRGSILIADRLPVRVAERDPAEHELGTRD